MKSFLSKLSGVKQMCSNNPLFILLVVTIGFIPFVGIAGSAISFLLFYFIAGMMTLMFFLKVYKGKKDFQIPRTFLAYFIPLTFLAATISAIANYNDLYSVFGDGATLDSWISILVFTSMFLVLINKKPEMLKFPVMARVIQYAFLLNILFALINIFSPYKLFPGLFIVNGAIEMVFFAGLTLLVSMLSIDYSQSVFSKVINYVSILLSLIFMAVFNVGIAWMSVLIISIYALYIAFSAKSKFKQSAVFYLFAFVFVLSSVFVLYGKTITYKYIAPYTNIVVQDTRPAFYSTMDVINNSFSSNKNKIIGAGPASFPYTWFAFKSSPADNITNYWAYRFKYSYSLPTQILNDFGVIGLIIFILFVLSVVSYAFRIHFNSTFRRKITEDALNKYIILLFLTMSFLLYMPSVYLFLVFVFVLAGFVAELLNSGVYKTFRPKPGRVKAFSVFEILFALFMFYFIVSILVSVVLSSFANSKLQAKNYGSALSYAKTASVIFPVKYLSINPEISVLEAKFRSVASPLKNEKDEDKIKSKLLPISMEIIDAEKQKVKSSPRDFNNWLEYASALARQYVLDKNKETLKEANSAMDKATRLAPFNPAIPVAKANLNLMLNDVKGAVAAYQQAIALKPNLSYAYGQLFGIAQANKAYKEAYQIALADFQNNPNNPSAIKRLIVAAYNVKDYKTVVSLVQQVIKLNPTILDLNSYYAYAMSLHNLGKTKDAVAILTKISKQVKNKQILELIDELKNSDNTGKDNNKKEGQKKDESKNTATSTNKTQ